MKRLTKVLLVVLLINTLLSFTYAGMGYFPRPDSTDPIEVVVLEEGGN